MMHGVAAWCVWGTGVLNLCVVLCVCKAFHLAESAFSGSKHGHALVSGVVLALVFGVCM